jgi:Carboxylesterase family
MLRFVCLTLCLLPLALTAPTGEKRQVSAGSKVHTQHATVVGTSTGGVDSFKGILFAQAPIGPWRLKLPQPIVANLGTIDATVIPRACAQYLTATNTSSLPSDTLGRTLEHLSYPRSLRFR